jgi:hypothetical protein
MGRSSLFFVLFSVFAVVALGFEDDFEAQFETESPSLKEKVVLKVEEILSDDNEEENKEEEKDFLDEFDDEEFVSSKQGSFSPSVPQQTQQQQQQQQAAKQKAAAAAQAQYKQQQKAMTTEDLFVFFTPDFCVIGLMLTYILYYLVGCMQNQAIANKFAEEFGPFFREAFLYLGVEGRYFRRTDTIEKNKDIIARLSPTEYSILGTGHKNCAGILLTLQLKSRQDFFSVVYNYFTKEKDDLMLEVPMNSLEMMNLLVIRKKEREYYEPTYGDKVAESDPVDCPEFGKDFCLVTDGDRSMISAIFGQHREVASTLKKYSGLIKSVHLTDQKQASTHAKCLRFVFVLPEDVSQLKTLLKMTLFLIDFLANYKHSPKVKSSVEFSRLKSAGSNNQKKRQEKLQQKKDKEWSEMTEEQKKKKLEREKMRKLKKRAGQMKVMSM